MSWTSGSWTSGAWLALGAFGQLVFTGRVLWQWLASERAGEVVVPRGYWQASLLASVCVALYAARLADPVFLAGPILSVIVFSRNLALERRQAGEAPASEGGRARLLALAALLVVLALVAAANRQRGEAVPAAWLTLGLSGYVLWSLRNVVQWWHAERAGQGVLPASYFALGLVGSCLLLLYALSRRDPVFVAAYALTPLPYLRNLLLGRRPTRPQPLSPRVVEELSRST